MIDTGERKNETSGPELLSCDSPLHLLYGSKDVIGCLLAQVRLNPNKVSSIFLNETSSLELTYSELCGRITQVSEIINSVTKIGDRILIAATGSEFFISFFACLMTRRIAVPIPLEKPTSRFSRFQTILADCEPAAILLRNEKDIALMHLADFDIRRIIVPPVTTILPDSIIPDSAEISENQIAMIQYTSGSTRNPEGVVLTHKNLMTNIRMIQQSMNLSNTDSMISWLPLHHDMGLIGMVLTPLLCGAATTIFPFAMFAKDPFCWLREMSNGKYTVTGAPNFAFDLINRKMKRSGENEANVDKFNLNSVRVLYSGSEKIHKAAVIEFYSHFGKHGLKEETFFPCYGLAEASLLVSGKYSDPSFFHLNDSSLESDEVISCGIPANGLKVQVVNDNGTLVPPDSVGEIEVEGASVSHGYWRKIRSEIEDGLLLSAGEPKAIRTGDLGFLRRGELFITGRKKDLIKIRGRNIHPEDVEPIIEALTNWIPSGGAVVCHSAVNGTESLIVLIEILRTRRHGNFSNLLRHVQSILGTLGLRCDRLVILQPMSLPKTSSGKKQRGKAKQDLIDHKLKVIWDSTNIKVEENSSETELEESLVELKRYVNEQLDILLSDERRTYPADFLLQLHRLGFLNLLIPKKLGGRGLSHSQFAKVAKTLGEIDLTVASLIGNHNTIGVMPIIQSKTLSSKDEILRKIATEGRIVSFALTEPEAGSNPRMVSTTVASKEPNKYILNGEKVWIGNSIFADYICVFAKELDASQHEIGVSAFLLDRSKHRYEVMGEQLTLGLKAMPQSRLRFKDILLTEQDRLSEPGKGLELAFESMEYARFALAATGVGVMNTAMSLSAGFAQSRKIWTGVLAENTYFGQWFGETHLRKVTLQTLVDRCINSLQETGRIPVQISLACKILAGEWVFESTDKALQFMGGRGFTEPATISRFYRDSRVIRIFEGPTEALEYQLGALIYRDPPKLIRSFVSTAKIKEAMSGLHKDIAAVLLGELGVIAISIDSNIHVESVKYLETVLTHSLNTFCYRFEKAISTSKNYREILSDIAKKDQPQYRLSRPSYDNWPMEEKPAETKMVETIVEQDPKPNEPLRSNEIKNMDRPANNNLSVTSDLVDWLKHHTRVASVDTSESLANFGVDSLLAYELLCFVEDTYLIRADENWVLERPSVRQLAIRIMERITSSGQSEKISMQNKRKTL